MVPIVIYNHFITMAQIVFVIIALFAIWSIHLVLYIYLAVIKRGGVNRVNFIVLDVTFFCVVSHNTGVGVGDIVKENTF